LTGVVLVLYCVLFWFFDFDFGQLANIDAIVLLKKIRWAIRLLLRGRICTQVLLVNYEVPFFKKFIHIIIFLSDVTFHFK
jgi:hypothetical protein